MPSGRAIPVCPLYPPLSQPVRRVFVSANKADFWEAKHKADIHPDLEPQLTAVGLEFFGTLEAALGSLGL